MPSWFMKRFSSHHIYETYLFLYQADRITGRTAYETLFCEIHVNYIINNYFIYFYQY